MFNLLSLPRASWKVRLAFFLWSALIISLIFQQWEHLHDDLALARWIAWFIVVGGVLYLPSLMMVVLFGRVPKLYQNLFKGLSRTLPQIHADFEREQQQQRDRSREL
ncbi:hypothetical protein PY254_12560 [Rhodanobacter sp. AS-Z3]|uniref:hypothetical protein n=1 Tax=Rhodanobacter sp. AS-Z3 TaxID=3031330 RepID=UPI00247AA8D3|nr:hypothetical protein [Rhodanobacter sp. AS-Z3]WEN14067.1 hypothetical protein PY254_12560 [Rhodanobacter sp. AS-Z3]